ncbi:LacI family DNA-binding transcriptional regulator [Sinomicrobium weinanense]|uniref:LacI family DNA-binding transcriptional regulator n=1 Tax=Sinomicrobium weinanense TaxID=2842200 RepID=A0A926JNP8_9FLAO|nr:LacI family DNA-binding transcriptional regulator [Sinomicrobium weinanense]MBC9794655.1 LacI family DNA-binding transcriptional regulator [Sinomicrobium weinanense]MBU3124140.1 LacI family transcriptional regulator [Sinomicrobium weinanense]
MKKGNPTIHEIARALNINSSTVSRALNDSSRVTQKTKEKVLAKAKELGYQRNLLASNLRRSRSNTIGVVVPRISRHFFSSTIAGIEEAAFSAGFNVIICQSLEALDREQRIVKNLIANRVDGILISVSMETTNSKHLEYFRDNGIPLVFFDRHCADMPDASKVLIDDRQAAYDAVTHLIGKGCRKIAHFSGPQELRIYKNRLKGYKEALRDNQITYNPKLVLTSKLMEADGYASAQKLLESSKDVDGIFAANDVSAIGAIKYLKKQGKQIPEDMAIVGFSNEPISEAIEPSLTTIDQSGFEIGKIACDLLVDNIRSRESTGIHNKTIFIDTTLIERGSTQKNG